MLAEGFLRLLRYREERKFILQARNDRGHTCTTSGPADTQQAGAHQEVVDSARAEGLKVIPQVPGLLIPRCSTTSSHPPVCVEDCSLLDQYPDLQVADSGLISHNPSKVANDHQTSDSEEPSAPGTSIPDQGYLVMGAGNTISLDLPGSGLEPMSNSLLNGLLEKQLEEVYMQHLTDNLARCDSGLENSLLRGLVLPPQPARETPSLETSLEETADGNRKISYLHTHNLGTCSSNFSSPVLRISESENLQPNGNKESK